LSLLDVPWSSLTSRDLVEGIDQNGFVPIPVNVNSWTEERRRC
jgi:hypothetical protein